MKSFYVFALVVVCSLLTCCGRFNSSSYRSPIISIGGCDSAGMCGVRLENGVILSDVRQPVIGSVPNCTGVDTCHEIIQ